MLLFDWVDFGAGGGGGGGGEEVVSHAEVFRGARISSFPTNTCSTENNIPFPQLANRKIDLDCRET